ncbi:MAG: hypothetical protein WCW03_01935 [Candidatus Paceibacterota bacterium]
MGYDNTYSKIFEIYKRPKRSENVIRSVMFMIQKARSRSLKIRAYFSGTLIILSALSIIPVINYAFTSVSQSGFIQYVSIFTFEWISMTQYWKVYTLSLLESAPIIESIALLSIFLLFIISVRMFSRIINLMSSNYQLNQ